MTYFLLADDSPMKRGMLQMMIERAQFPAELLLTASTEEAKRLINMHHDISHAFIDYEMPSENGPAVIAYLHDKNPAAHIALVTSADSEEYEREARNAGAEAFVCISKSADEVERTLMELLESWKVADENVTG